MNFAKRCLSQIYDRAMFCVFYIEIVVNLELVSAAESPNILRDFSICVCQLLVNLYSGVPI